MRRIIRNALLIVVPVALGSCGGDDPTGPNPQTASVTVSPDVVSLLLNESRQLTAVPRDAGGAPITGRSIAWTTSHPEVATVSSTGLVAAVGVGSATIAATTDGKTGEATITVAFPPVASITVTPGNATLLLGTADQWVAVARDAAGNALTGVPLTWSTTTPSVATVSNAGIVTAQGEGNSTITATADGKSGSAPVSVITVTFTSIAAGGAHSCGLTTSGAAYCWGRNESGQLGVPVPATTCATDAGTVACITQAVPVGGGRTFAQLAAGGAHTCGLTSDGTAYCWGNNATGQLGDNTATQRVAPVAVATDLKFAALDLGAAHTCGLTAAGIAHCWGSNTRGQLGDATTNNRLVPVPVGGGHTFQQIVAGGFNIGHTCALAVDGAAYCWGDNEKGALGLGTMDLNGHSVPAAVAGGLVFASLTAGLGGHTCGRTAAGVAYCWGENTFGGLGNGSTNSTSLPDEVSGGHSFTQLIAGGFIGHTCGLVAGGAAYCWGENERGQVGDGSTVDRLEPSAVVGSLSFEIVDAGFRHTCGRTGTGVVYCWGSGATGQLGINSVNPSSQPRKVLGQP